MNLRICAAVLVCATGYGQPVTSLPEAVSAAIARYPSVRVSSEQVQAASAAIALARTAYLPRADVLAQLNRATRNNVFGLLLPQSTLPTISGPPKPENDLTSVWGSAVGFLVSWEPFDFGLRKARVDTAETGQRRAEAAVVRTKLEVGAIAADAYLTLLAAEQMLKAAEAHRARAQTVLKLVSALVDSELRPGADLSRSRAELAASETQVIQAEQARKLAEITLRQFTGEPIVPSIGRYLSSQPPMEVAKDEAVSNPYIAEQRAVVAESAARERELLKVWYPRFLLQASSYARGTGANPDGTTGGLLSGIGPNIQNWAAGMAVTFPALELPSLRQRREIERHRHASEVARQEQITLEVLARKEKAAASLDAARRMLEQAPRQLEAAQTGERQARARYEAGLSTLVEVADAQRLLTQAEIDDSLARLNVWRAALNGAVAAGDLQPFLEAAR